MKNIPMFTTEAGTASLIFEEIPYKKEAYIRIHDTSSPQVLVDEAVSLCRAAGAELVFATGCAFLEKYPFHTEIVRMEYKKEILTTGKLKLVPVEPDTLLQWCDIYNENMRTVPNTATLYEAKLKKEKLLNNCYFVYEDINMIGIGVVRKGVIDAVVSLVRGRGKDVMLALCNALDDEIVSVEVAVNNLPAISLYKKMGFVEVESMSKWYCVYKSC